MHSRQGTGHLLSSRPSGTSGEVPPTSPESGCPWGSRVQDPHLAFRFAERDPLKPAILDTQDHARPGAARPGSGTSRSRDLRRPASARSYQRQSCPNGAIPNPDAVEGSARLVNRELGRLARVLHEQTNKMSGNGVAKVPCRPDSSDSISRRVCGPTLRPWAAAACAHK